MAAVDCPKVEVRDQSKVGNAANTVNVDTQTNSFGGARQDVEVNEDCRQWFQGNTSNSNNRTIMMFYNSFPPPLPPPNNSPAAYLLTRSGQIQPSDSYVWNAELGGLASMDAHERQQAQM
jgi:hypothetical protein